jgi:Ketopantoate hydroxymethyltransferase
VRRLEAIGVFAVELEEVPGHVAEAISQRTSLRMLGMGAGPGADAQDLVAEDMLGHPGSHKPRHAKTYRDFAPEFAWLHRASALQPSGSSLRTWTAAPSRERPTSCLRPMPSSRTSSTA